MNKKYQMGSSGIIVGVLFLLLFVYIFFQAPIHRVIKKIVTGDSITMADWSKKSNDGNKPGKALDEFERNLDPTTAFPDGKAPVPKYEVQIKTDIKYATIDGIDLYLDLYQPKGITTKTPVVVWMHGGSFRVGTRNGGKYIGPVLAGQGYTLASIEYRLSSQALFPAPVHDFNGAVRYLRANAEKYNLDADRFASMGNSAGSIIATVAGVTWDEPETHAGVTGGNLSQPTKVRGVIDAFGSIHSSTSDSTRSPQMQTAKETLGCDPLLPECAPQLELFLAENYLNKEDPSFLILNGELDKIIPVENARALAADMKEAGMDVTLITDPKYGHSEEVTFAHIYEVLDFLARIFR